MPRRAGAKARHHSNSPRVSASGRIRKAAPRCPGRSIDGVRTGEPSRAAAWLRWRGNGLPLFRHPDVEEFLRPVLDAELQTEPGCRLNQKLNQQTVGIQPLALLLAPRQHGKHLFHVE